jgi:hypothetical protein
MTGNSRRRKEVRVNNSMAKDGISVFGIPGKRDTLNELKTNYEVNSWRKWVD